MNRRLASLSPVTVCSSPRRRRKAVNDGSSCGRSAANSTPRPDRRAMSSHHTCSEGKRAMASSIERTPLTRSLVRELFSCSSLLCSSLRALCRKRELIISALSSKLPPSSFDISSRLLKKFSILLINPTEKNMPFSSEKRS